MTSQGKATFLEVILGAEEGHQSVLTHRGEWRDHRDSLDVLPGVAESCTIIEFLEAKFEFLEEEMSDTAQLIFEIEGQAAVDSDLCAAQNVMLPIEVSADGQPLSF